MPRYPDSAPETGGIELSAFSSVAGRLALHEGETFPFHVGDTWMEPPEGCRMEDIGVREYPGMHRYSPPQGMPALIDALVERCRTRTCAPTERENILVSAGATGGLGTVIGTVVSPGDEVLILAPYWPLIEGVVRAFRGAPVPVPFMGIADSPESAVEVIDAHITDRTVALYVSTPNNPTGKLIPGPWLEAILEWSFRHDLWVVSDEVYEDYVYDGLHTYCRPLAPERTFSVHSFSKAYGMAGNRIGYVAGPAGAMKGPVRIGTHTVYNAPTASQIAVLRALDGPGDRWVTSAREQYGKMGDEAAGILGVDRPQGSTFLFIDVADLLPDGDLHRLLEDLADHGITAAPGPSFGPYPTHLRVCFTAAPPDKVSRGMRALAAFLRARRVGGVNC